MYDVALELRSRDDVAVTELEVFDEKTSSVKGLVTTDAG